ncbi:hypothetical protein [Nitrosomonas sp. Nm33]|uniref:hypothetical protein n=1 Tax=Nitrosomonas sp. Nm33 TaxID=133724 RepID=UPI0008946369|nr:hypothetical protein [Nitrosomonas sp. Nm33]SDZ04900.1 hypothetical protein SAMN05421755_10933 [Nitrosomonas sp. Nm33]
MQRIHFLVPDINVARSFVDELLLAQIEEQHIHIIVKRDTPLEEEELPKANLLQKSGFIQQIHFLVPDINAARRFFADELLLAQIKEKSIYIVVKRSTPLKELPKTNLLQKSGFTPAVQQRLARSGTGGRSRS